MVDCVHIFQVLWFINVHEWLHISGQVRGRAGARAWGEDAGRGRGNWWGGNEGDNERKNNFETWKGKIKLGKKTFKYGKKNNKLEKITIDMKIKN